MAQTDKLARVRQMCRTGEAKEIRITAGVTLREAAEGSGSSAATILRWENGARPIGATAIRYFELLERLRRIIQKEVTSSD